MKCPNIWCVVRSFEGECDNIGGVGPEFVEECLMRINYESVFCPTEEEFGPVNLSNVKPDQLQPDCTKCGSICVDTEKDSEGNVVCPEEYKMNLQLNLIKYPYDLIWSGIKKEEYRDITEHYISLLFNWRPSGLTRTEFKESLLSFGLSSKRLYLKDHDNIIFSNGYRKDRPQMEVEYIDIGIGYGRQEWGAVPNKKTFILYLGEVYQDLPF